MKRHDKKFSNKEVAAIVESEGLDYAIQHYMSAESIQDPKLAELWEEASHVLQEIETIIYPDGIEAYDESLEEDCDDEEVEDDNDAPWRTGREDE